MALERFSATFVSAYKRGSPKLVMLRSRTVASASPTCSVAGRFASPGEDARLAIRLRGDDGLLRLTARAGQFCLGDHHRLFCLFARSRKIGVALVLGDADLHLRVGQFRLLGGDGLCFVQRAQFFRRGALAVVRFQLLDAQLPHAKLFEQCFDFAGAGSFCGVGLSDQDIHTFDIEFMEASLQLVARFNLNFIAMLQNSSMVFLWATSRK